jgi:hypothetical protein
MQITDPFLRAAIAPSPMYHDFFFRVLKRAGQVTRSVAAATIINRVLGTIVLPIRAETPGFPLLIVA